MREKKPEEGLRKMSGSRAGARRCSIWARVAWVSSEGTRRDRDLEPMGARTGRREGKKGVIIGRYTYRPIDWDARLMS